MQPEAALGLFIALVNAVGTGLGISNVHSKVSKLKKEIEDSKSHETTDKHAEDPHQDSKIKELSSELRHLKQMFEEQKSREVDPSYHLEGPGLPTEISRDTIDRLTLLEQSNKSKDESFRQELESMKKENEELQLDLRRMQEQSKTELEQRVEQLGQQMDEYMRTKQSSSAERETPDIRKIAATVEDFKRYSESKIREVTQQLEGKIDGVGTDNKDLRASTERTIEDMSRQNLDLQKRMNRISIDREEDSQQLTDLLELLRNESTKGEELKENVERLEKEKHDFEAQVNSRIQEHTEQLGLYIQKQTGEHEEAIKTELAGIQRNMQGMFAAEMQTLKNELAHQLDSKVQEMVSSAEHRDSQKYDYIRQQSQDIESLKQQLQELRTELATRDVPIHDSAEALSQRPSQELEQRLASSIEDKLQNAYGNLSTELMKNQEAFAQALNQSKDAFNEELERNRETIIKKLLDKEQDIVNRVSIPLEEKVGSLEHQLKELRERIEMQHDGNSKKRRNNEIPAE